ncbi:MAG: WYL domain-containing protein [Burkholderiales bacterium PBB4]|nr:MAG: WYL domain-containing protein [Burkholderiales bacterium PBB4]
MWARSLLRARAVRPRKRSLATPTPDVSQTQRERLAFLELRAFFSGELRRGDIEARFGVKPAAASRDLSSYRDIAPDNLDYDAPARCYRPSATFKPVFGDGLDLKLRQVAPCEGPGQLVKPDLEVLATITRALVAKRAVRVNYLSLSSGSKRRELVPVALADNGLRWHIRAFDRERDRFGDFVLTRITKAQEIDGEVAESEQIGADEQWARIVDLEIVPHPDVTWPKAVEADYLRRWNIDSSPDHRLDAASHHLWLKNTQTLYGVESAALAPGYAVDGAGQA